MTKLAPEWVRTSDPVIRSPARYRWTTAPASTLCWSKTRLSFSGADNSCISWPINTIFVPRIGMYIRINITKMDFIYLKIWCNSVIFCQRGHFFYSPCSTCIAQETTIDLMQELIHIIVCVRGTPMAWSFQWSHNGLSSICDATKGLLPLMANDTEASCCLYRSIIMHEEHFISSIYEHPNSI